MVFLDAEPKDNMFDIVTGEDFEVDFTIPSGMYGFSAEIKFDAEKLTFKGEARATIDTTIVSISKQDITTKKELPGATLVLKNDEGDIVETWVSTEIPHIIYNLPLGRYTLTEEKAPDGYALSTETITFDITDFGVEKKVVMYNDVEEIVEVPVEPTSSFSTMTMSIVGLIIIGFGSMLIYKNYKKNEE